MHVIPLIQDLAIILGTAGLISLIFHKIKQPVILGYLVAGVIVGPYTPPFSFVVDVEGVRTWGELGIIFLMFAMGLEFNFKKLKEVGLTSVAIAITESVFMIAVGFFVGKLMGYPVVECFYLGAILAISSTTIIIKALEEMKLKTERFASIIFGVLVVEDLIGIFMLVGLSYLGKPETLTGMGIFWSLLKLFLFVGSWIFGGKILIPPLINYAGAESSRETLTVLSLGLCLALSVLAMISGYSGALGAFIMGSLIAESQHALPIEKLIKPVQDVFAAIFFVSIGMLLNPQDLLKYAGPIMIFTLVTIIGKIFSSTFSARLVGENSATSWQVGMSLGQIGEFSFIIAGLGLTQGNVGPSVYPIAVAVSIITTFTTPYLIRLSRNLFLNSIETQAIQKEIP